MYRNYTNNELPSNYFAFHTGKLKNSHFHMSKRTYLANFLAHSKIYVVYILFEFRIRIFPPKYGIQIQENLVNFKGYSIFKSITSVFCVMSLIFIFFPKFDNNSSTKVNLRSKFRSTGLKTSESTPLLIEIKALKSHFYNYQEYLFMYYFFFFGLQ